MSTVVSLLLFVGIMFLIFLVMYFIASLSIKFFKEEFE